jgi:hypothetical protein
MKIISNKVYFYFILVIFIILSSSKIVFSQTPLIQWLWSQGGSGDDFVNGVIETNDSNYVFSGTSTSNDGDLLATGNYGGRDGWIYKTVKNTGTIIWSSHFGGPSNDQIWRVIETTNLELAGIGITSSASLPGFHSSGELYLVKMNASGGLLWQKCYGGSGTDWGDNIVQANNGNFIICGKTNTNNNGDLTGIAYNGGTSDLWVAEIDASGAHNIVSGRNKCFGGSSVEDFGCIAKSSDGGYIVSCRTNSNNGMVAGNHGDYDAWILKLDSMLNIKWSKCYGGTAGDIPRNVFQDLDGNFVISGNSSSNDGDLLNMNIGLVDYWICKLDSGGAHNILWNKTLGGTQNDFGNCGARASDSGYLICGRSFSYDGNVSFSWGQGDCWMAKLNATNPAGALDWEKTIGGTEYDGANWIIQSSDGGVVIAAEGRSGDGDITGHNYHPPGNPAYEEAYTFKFVPPPPLPPDSIFGPDSCMQTNTYTFACTPVNNATGYLWNFSGTGVTITPNGTSAQYYFSNTAPSGNVTVQAINDYGISPSTSKWVVVYSPPPPPAPDSIMGPDSCLQTNTCTFTCTPVNDATGYLWNFSGSGVTITPMGIFAQYYFSDTATSGNVIVQAVNDYGISPQTNKWVVVWEYVGIREIDDDFIIYPNPGLNILRIQTNQKWNRFEIFNLAGQLQKSGRKEETIFLGDLPSGIYILDIDKRYRFIITKQ